MFKPGDILCLTDMAIFIYKNMMRPPWWEIYWPGKNPKECLMKFSHYDGDVVYGELLDSVRPFKGGLTDAKNCELYIPLSKEEKLLRKISYLYGKCKTTKQWVTS